MPWKDATGGSARTALDYDDLPNDEIARREVLEERSLPDPEKPRLDDKLELELAEVEERTAQAYLEAEETTFRMHRMARKIRDGWVPRSVSLPE